MKDDNAVDVFLNYWPMIGAAVAFIAGYTELKVNHKSLRSDFDGEKTRRDRERATDAELTRDMFREIRADIKEGRDDVKLLLQRDRGSN
jgi:hypothetical protein